MLWRRGWDSNPRYGSPYARFRGEYFQPLSHLSAVFGLVSLANPAALLLRAGRGGLATEVVLEDPVKGRSKREYKSQNKQRRREEAGRRKAREERITRRRGEHGARQSSGEASGERKRRIG